MKAWFLSALTFLGLVVSNVSPSDAQINLIRNSGFDTLSACPTKDNRFLELANGWWPGVPEGVVPRRIRIFSRCAPYESEASVPAYIIYRYQQPRSRDGYIGLLVYSAQFPDAFFSYLEFAETRLLAGLQAGKQYYIEFFATPDYNSSPDRNNVNFFIGSLGLAFSGTAENPYTVAGGFSDLHPAIQHPEKKVINDTGGWTRVNGAYRADGTERYALVGNFIPSRNTYAETYPPNAIRTANAHYFIEDVGVYEFDPLPDTVYLCDGQRRISGRFLDASYRWSNGDTDSVSVIRAPGKYWMQATLDDVVLSDTVVVIDPNDFAVNVEDSVCTEGIPLRLTAPLKGTYTWSNGSHERTIVASAQGTYAVTVQNECKGYQFQWEIKQKECSCPVFVPSAFTPNGDGRNDFLHPSHHCDYYLNQLAFRVYNRWGQQVYISFNPQDKGWDGTLNGVPQPMGTYFWTLEYANWIAGRPQKFSYKGDLVLIR